MNANYCQPQTHRPAGAKKAWRTAIGLAFVGVVGVVGPACVVNGPKPMENQLDELRHMQAYVTLQQVYGGIVEYCLETGAYPELGSWGAMVGPGSPLVTGHMIRAGLPVNDPWGAPFEGRSTKSAFELKCAGRPDKGDDLGPITITQDRVVGAPGTPATAAAHP
jgi:hypothetical protein